METFGFYTKQCQSFLGFMNEVKRFKLTQVDDDSILHFLKKMPSNLKIMPSDEEITNIFTKYVLKRNSDYQKRAWNIHEKTLLIWVVFFFLKINHKKQIELNRDDWKQIGLVLTKNSVDCVFKFNSLMVSSIQLNNWTLEEENLLFNIIRTKQKKQHTYRWIDVAKEFYEKSDSKFFRNEKICRSHWISHLDPSLNKTNWTDEEDFLLMNEYSIHKAQWTKISKKMIGRNVYSLKNRFSTLCKKLHLDGKTDFSPPQNNFAILPKIPVKNTPQISTFNENNIQNQHQNINPEIIFHFTTIDLNLNSMQSVQNTNSYAFLPNFSPVVYYSSNFPNNQNKCLTQSTYSFQNENLDETSSSLNNIQENKDDSFAKFINF